MKKVNACPNCVYDIPGGCRHPQAKFKSFWSSPAYECFEPKDEEEEDYFYPIVPIDFYEIHA